MPSKMRRLSEVAGSAPVRTAVNQTFHTLGRRRASFLAHCDVVAQQRKTLLALTHRARNTRFGRDHAFSAIGSVAEYQKAVPLRTYEDLWADYLRDQYPIFDNLTWPGRVPYLALTSGTTQGATKYIPVTREMVASNAKATKTMVGMYLANHPKSRLFHGKLFFLGGSTDLERPAPGVAQGDLSGIATLSLNEFLRPYIYPPMELALEPDWDTKLTRLAKGSLNEPITLVGGVPSWLLVLFEKLREISGKSTLAEIWPRLEMIVHGGVKFDPYRKSFQKILGSDRIRLQETYPCSEGFIAFGDMHSEHLRLVYDNALFYEFVPTSELNSPNPTRHWLGNAQTGINYAIVVSTCAGMWSHIIGDTIRFESLRPPLLTFTGRTKYTLSAFGEHLISEEVERAIATASHDTHSAVRDWHVGPVFEGTLGHHCYVLEFLEPPEDLAHFRTVLDADLCHRNADYKAHRAEGVGLPLPAVVVASKGGFEAWMRSRGKVGGQNKVPRMDNSGELTSQLVSFLRQKGHETAELPPA